MWRRALAYGSDRCADEAVLKTFDSDALFVCWLILKCVVVKLAFLHVLLLYSLRKMGIVLGQWKDTNYPSELGIINKWG